MPRLKAAIEIDAPREHVFAIAGDLTKRPEWTTFVKEFVITSGDGKTPGSTDRMIGKIGPQKNRWEGTLVRYEPNEVIERRFEGYFKGEERMTFTALNGRTRVEWHVNYTPPFGIIGKFGAWFMMARIYLNELENSLENLKRELEV
jgi:uncharacterized membrane protein